MSLGHSEIMSRARAAWRAVWPSARSAWMVGQPLRISRPHRRCRYGRRLPVPRGKLLGGSSSINGMVFVRGQAQDFDTWAQMGNRGWS